MKPWMKVCLGISSHWFFIYFPVFILAIVSFAVMSEHHHTQPAPELMIPGIILLVLVHLGSILLMMGTMGLFIAYAAKQPAFSSNERILWILLLAFLGAFAQPIFYWMYVFRHPMGAPFFSGGISHAGIQP